MSAADLRRRAAEAARAAADLAITARATAVAGKRVPDQLLADADAARAGLDDKLRAALGVPEETPLGGLPDFVAQLLRHQAERAGELITELTEGALRRAAVQQGRAAAFTELAGEAASELPPADAPPAPFEAGAATEAA